jgi:heptaprenyl diphosphate synthase
MKLTLIDLIRVALLLAVAIVIHFIEAFFVIPIGGFHLKIGLSNSIILFALFRMNVGMVLFFSVCKSFFSFLYEPAFTSMTWLISMGGSLLSVASMILCKKIVKEKIIPISVIGGIFHNIGQMVVICIVVKTFYIAFYLPLLILIGATSGYITGIMTKWVLNKTDKSVFFGNKV